MQIVRRRTMLLLVPLGLLALTLGIWWLLSGINQEVQAVSSNACTADEAYYIAKGEASAGERVTVRTHTEVSPSALRVVFSDPNGNVKVEKIRIGDATEEQRSALRSSESSSIDPALIPANFTRHAASGTIYHRQLDGGTWTGWVSEREELDKPLDVLGFCGSPMSELTGLQRIGSESVDGVSTTKYTATVEFDDDTAEVGPLDLRLDWWVDSDGRLKRKTITHLAYNSKVVTTFSDFGQVKTINAPVTPTPAPTAATATPVPATATPRPPPSGLAASASGTDSIVLSWTALPGASRYGV